jgi:hypothetical protein
MNDDGNKVLPPQAQPAPPLNIRIGKENDRVIVNFGRQIVWVGFDPIEAIMVANNMIGQALSIIREPSRIIKPV